MFLSMKKASNSEGVPSKASRPPGAKINIESNNANSNCEAGWWTVAMQVLLSLEVVCLRSCTRLYEAKESKPDVGSSNSSNGRFESNSIAGGGPPPLPPDTFFIDSLWTSVSPRCFEHGTDSRSPPLAVHP